MTQAYPKRWYSLFTTLPEYWNAYPARVLEFIVASSAPDTGNSLLQAWSRTALLFLNDN